MSDRDKVIGRIRKLQMKAGDTAVTQEEAATFAQKAAAMIEEHMISESELKVEAEEIIEEIITYSRWTRGHKYLISAVCETMGVRMLTSSLGGVFMFVGRPTNVAASRETVNRILDQIHGVAFDSFGDQPIEMVEYEVGLLLGVMNRIYKIRRQSQSEANPDDLPVLADEIKLVDESLDGDMKIEISDPRSEIKSAATAYGVLSSDRIKLNESVGDK